MSLHDIMLAKEVAARRPNLASDWDSIATALSEAFSTDEKKVDLTGRACRERMNRLLQKYREDDRKSLKKWVLNKCLFTYFSAFEL
jgi:hypothetical protein